MSNINIAFTVTENWLPYAVITITSILSNASNDDYYNFYIVSNGFNNSIKADFLLLNNIKLSGWHFIKTDDSEYTEITHNWMGSVSCYRLNLPTLVNVDKLLFLDADILALGDIAELYRYDISNYYLAAVEDKQYSMRLIISLEKDETYFNGGVQLLNLKKFREDNIQEKMYSILKKFDWTDQDAVNYICRKKILSLPLKYNIMSVNNDGYKYRREEYEKSIQSPLLMHFSQHKPWIKNNIIVPFKNKWLEYENMFNDLKNKKA